MIEYGLKVNARIGYKTIKKFKLWFKYIDSETKQPHEVYEYVEENSPIPVFHIHDEIVVEAKPEQTLEDVEALFSEPIDWCRDLPLKGAGYTTPYYLKD